MSQYKATGQGVRKNTSRDPRLELRGAAAAAVTQTNGSFASPGFDGTPIDFGEARRLGRAILHDLAITLPTENDGFAHFAIVGVNAAGDEQVELASLRLGCKEVTNQTNDDASDQVDLEILFDNAARGVIWPKIKLVIVCSSTSSLALDCESWIVPFDPGVQP